MSIFERSEFLLGEDAIKILSKAHVAVFGIGGVGSYAVEALGRCAVGEISLFDSDTVSQSNINRQLIATVKTVGTDKTKAAESRLKNINPKIKVNANKLFFSAENADSIDFNSFDYVIDAIDTVSSKLLLAEICTGAGVPIISCMGTGNKLDPTKFEISDISKTSVCPLAKVMRCELRKKGINHLKVLYSKEAPVKKTIDENGRHIPGSVSFVPSAAGLIIAGEVIKDLIMR